ncbi:hypothetical protein QAD02_020335 [Eretmocerus hayati]|uniref:Uncharacterized protein n=1 Tax=Eretmocerus hayati TaxID=131215 RepID=A0ACC2PN67_9HYME|nr:hypothetical protein QAD02_020335 [Eretmocerus hayati]
MTRIRNSGASVPRSQDVEAARPAKKSRIVPWETNWQRDVDLKNWVQKHPTDSQTAYCKYCRRNYKFSHKECLREHAIAKTTKHEDDINDAKLAGTFVEDVVQRPSYKGRVHSHKMELAMIMASHQVALHFIDDLLPLIENLNEDPEAVGGMEMRRIKLIQVIHMMCKVDFEALIQILNSTFFSLLLDESTDISGIKLLCAPVQYVHPITKEIMTHLLQLIEINAKNANAGGLWDALVEFARLCGLNIRKAVGMGCDNASVFLGSDNGFKVFLRKMVPHLFVLNCICHTSAIISKGSCEKIPKEVDELLSFIYAWFPVSPKRFEELKDSLELYRIATQRIKRISGTRWLEAQKCYAQMIELWNGLVNYLDSEVFNIDSTAHRKKFDNETNVEKRIRRIPVLLHDKSVHAYIFYLQYILNFFNSSNAQYQTKNLAIHKLWRSIEELFIDVGSYAITQDGLTNIMSPNFSIEQNKRYLNDINLGNSRHQMLAPMQPLDVSKVRENCSNFFVTAITEMRKRLLEHRDFLGKLIFLEPTYALNDDRQLDMMLALCRTYFPRINVDIFIVEWTNSPCQFQGPEAEYHAQLDAQRLWKIVMLMKDAEGKSIFPTLSQAKECIFSLPHSNAEPERKFSLVNPMKDK